MTRTATGAELALLEALEPEALIGWEAEILNMREAIDLSRAITDRRLADAAEAQRVTVGDQATIALKALPVEVQETIPPAVRGRNDPDFDTELP